MKHSFIVCVEIDNDTFITKAQCADMIRRDIGSNEGSLPPEQAVTVKKVTVKFIKGDHLNG